MFGVIQLKVGVVFTRLRSWTRPERELNRSAMCLALHLPARRNDSNHGNGKCLGRYWLVAVAALGLG